jgi:hypothetical protein
MKKFNRKKIEIIFKKKENIKQFSFLFSWEEDKVTIKNMKTK